MSTSSALSVECAWTVTTVPYGVAEEKKLIHVMEIDMVIDWLSFLLLGLAFWAYRKGYQKGKSKGFRESYQTDLNCRIESFLDNQDSK